MPADSLRLTNDVRLVRRVRRTGVLRNYCLPQRGDRVGKGRDTDFAFRNCAVTGPFDVYWKVKNTGRGADSVRQPRGPVVKGGTSRHETTSYVGSHSVEVYNVQNGVCVARDRQSVIIQPRTAVEAAPAVPLACWCQLCAAPMPVPTGG